MSEAKAKILFVDDDNFLRKVYDAELSENNYDVILAVDGIDGLDKARTEDPDLIILDMIMPRKNGFEVLTDLQSDSKLANIPVIILSNLGQEGDIQKGLDLGAVDYLVKDNTTLSIIIEKIEHILHSKTQSKISRLQASPPTAKPSAEPAKIIEGKPIVNKTSETLQVDQIVKKSVEPTKPLQPDAPVKTVYCPQCGTQLKAQYKFCTSCGYKLT